MNIALFAIQEDACFKCEGKTKKHGYTLQFKAKWQGMPQRNRKNIHSIRPSLPFHFIRSFLDLWASYKQPSPNKQATTKKHTIIVTGLHKMRLACKAKLDPRAARWHNSKCKTSHITNIFKAKNSSVAFDSIAMKAQEESAFFYAKTFAPTSTTYECMAR